MVRGGAPGSEWPAKSLTIQNVQLKVVSSNHDRRTHPARKPPQLQGSPGRGSPQVLSRNAVESATPTHPRRSHDAGKAPHLRPHNVATAPQKQKAPRRGPSKARSHEANAPHPRSTSVPGVLIEKGRSCCRLSYKGDKRVATLLGPK